MKKLILFILMLVSILTLGACSKKEATPRTMANFINDFTMNDSNFDSYEKIIKNEKELNRFEYLNKVTGIAFTSKYKSVINSISFTIYNHSEDFSFYIYDPIYARVIKSDNNHYMMDAGVYEKVYNNRIEIKPGEEYDIVCNLNQKIGKNSVFQVFNLICVREEDPQEDFKKIKEAGGIYNFKVDYSVYL